MHAKPKPINTFISRKLAVVLSVSTLIVFGGCSGVLNEATIKAPRFYPDGKRVILTYCNHTSPCTLATFDLGRKSLVLHNQDKIDPNDSFTSDAAFSRDGKQMAYIIGKENSDVTQIAIQNIDGSMRQKITTSPGHKRTPSFSPDGKRIIFLAGFSFGKTHRKRVAGFDVFEIDLETGQQKQITNYNMYSASAPYFLPNGKDFIFYAIASRNWDSAGDNNIFILSNQSNQKIEKDKLKPILINGDYSGSPTISNDGSKIIFVSRTDKTDRLNGDYTYDLFIRENGKIFRLTYAKSRIRHPSFSTDGEKIVFFAEKTRHTSWDAPEHFLGIINADGTGLEKMIIPTPEP